MQKEMLNESVSRDRERSLAYKTFSSVFSYPNDEFFKNFPQLAGKRKTLTKEYDILFRNRSIWLYTSEYTTQDVFQKSNQLSDIRGFYKAFGLDLDEERPDALSIELEFMHYLIFKGIYAVEKNLPDAQEKKSICRDAQKKFFNEHLYPGAKIIIDKIMSQKDDFLYKDIAQDMLDMLEEEHKYFNSLEN